MGSMGNTPPIWVWCLGTFLLVFVHLRVGPGILHLYARTTLLHRFAFSASSLRSSLHSRRPSHGKQGVALLNTEEGRVNDAQWIRLRFHQLRAQLALAIYTLLPALIMTSTLVAVYFASCSISKCGHPRMASFSAASFSALYSSFRFLRSSYIIS